MTSDYITAEYSVIGSLLIDAKPCLPVVQGILKPEDFTTEINAEVYRIILELDREGTTVDPVTICERAGNRLGDIKHYMMGCMDATPTAVNVEVYTNAVKNAAMLRAVKDAAYSIQEQAEEATDYKEVLNSAVGTFSKLQESGTGNSLVSSQEAMLDLYEYRSHFDENPEAMFARTGFENLDYLLGGGFLNSGLYIVAARPGIGKTTIALNIADNMAERGSPVLFISLEMPKEEITAKRLASRCGVPYDVILMKQMSEGEYDKMARASTMMAKWPVTVNRRPGASVRQIESMARSVKGLRCLMIDYLGLIRPDRHGKSRYEEITEISGQLKSVALRLGVPVLCLAQLNRETEREKGGRPQMYHLRDSGAIEQDADGIMLLHREADNPEAKAYDGSECECILSKNRHGRTGITKFSFYGAVSKLVPIRDGRKYD